MKKLKNITKIIPMKNLMRKMTMKMMRMKMMMKKKKKKNNLVTNLLLYTEV